ncbi:MAG: sensor histidine kinase, partial [Schaedlerella sp.]|uniref:sensor histidine kinase n=1 Tax=Schaedlerella sp. TaxID=2676057 RepID=UPI003528275A
GIGIPEEEQGKVFQRFYRASNVKDQQGFGIGLYLAREVFSRQQGYIRLKSALNQGTTAELFLLRN